MTYEVDVHTHTLASGHAYSTMKEMIEAAKEKGMKGLGITEHAPLMDGTCKEIYFRNLRVVPREIDGVRLLLGAECNVYDEEGHLDLSLSTLKRLDVRIASLHVNVYSPKQHPDAMPAYRGIMKNPLVDIIGHPDDGRYQYDYEELAYLAAQHNKIIEINNTSLRPGGVRPHAYENDCRLLEQCRKHAVPVLMGSDAHICYDVCAHEAAEAVLEEAGYPKELILNYSLAGLLSRLAKNREKWVDLEP